MAEKYQPDFFDRYVNPYQGSLSINPGATVDYTTPEAQEIIRVMHEKATQEESRLQNLGGEVIELVTAQQTDSPEELPVAS
jgi:hypothetical protein